MVNMNSTDSNVSTTRHGGLVVETPCYYWKSSIPLRLTTQRPVQPLNRLINLGVALEADHHRVDEAAFDGVLDGLLAVFGLGEIAVAAELHGDDAAPFGMHRFDLFHRLIIFARRGVDVRQILINVMALRVDAGELDFHPIT